MGPRRRQGWRAAVAVVHIHAVLGEEGALLTPKINPELPACLHRPPGGVIHVQVASRGKRLKAGAAGMGKGTAAGRFAPGVPARQLQAGHLPQDPRGRIGAGRASTHFKKALKREENSSYLLQSAIARSVRPLRPLPCSYTRGWGRASKRSSSKKGSGDESSTQGCHCVLPTVPCQDGDGSRGLGPPKGATKHPPCDFGHLQATRVEQARSVRCEAPAPPAFGVFGVVCFFFGCWILRCSCASCFLPNTQGPRRAFKIPFITMEPPRLRAQAIGPGGGFWG